MARIGIFVASAVLAVLGAGCDVVFGLGVEAPAVCENPGTRVGLTVLADATLDGATPLGTDGTLRLTSSSRVLVRLRRPQLLDRISLRVGLADYAVGCQPDIDGCVPCVASSLGTVQVFLVDNQWDEATVTGDERQPGVPWMSADRVLLGTFPFGSTGLLRLESLDFTIVERRFAGDEITLELVGAAGTDARFAAREGNDCVDAAPPDATGSCESQVACDDCEPLTCGDGNPEPPEECDDGNLINDACERNCTRAACGNGLVTGDEECDDKDPTAPQGLVCVDCSIVNYCGNGVKEVAESCDDGNLTAQDGCEPDCRLSRCGDGIKATTEECDDGNFVGDDGCDPNCTFPLCGNNFRGSTEECDDGNLVDGDGCTGVCVCESFCGINT